MSTHKPLQSWYSAKVRASKMYFWTGLLLLTVFNVCLLFIHTFTKRILHKSRHGLCQLKIQVNIFVCQILWRKFQVTLPSARNNGSIVFFKTVQCSGRLNFHVSIKEIPNKVFFLLFTSYKINSVLAEIKAIHIGAISCILCTMLFVSIYAAVA